MVDITLCTNNECPIRNSCYRYVALPTPERQSYSNFKPYTTLAGLTCDSYIPANGHRDVQYHSDVDKFWEKNHDKQK